MTHKQLVEIGYRWVLKNTSCGIAFKELNSYACNGEFPDVIGFGSHGHSVLVEAKVSKADFYKDRKKLFRKNPELGMGSQRFYLCEKNLLKVSDMPVGWGLIWVEKGKAKTIHSPYKGKIGERINSLEKNIRAEHGFMYSALRRLFIKGYANAVYDKQYPRYGVTANDIISANENIDS